MEISKQMEIPVKNDCITTPEKGGEANFAFKNEHEKELFSSKQSFTSKMEDGTSFTITEKSVSSYGRKGSKDGEFNYPGSLTVTAGGRLFVVDSGNKRIQEFDAEGNFKTGLIWEDPSVEIGDIAADVESGTLLVLKYSRNKYKQPVATFISTISLSNLRETNSFPLRDSPGIMFFCIRSDGTLAASDHKEARIKIYTKEGEYAQAICLRNHNVVPGKICPGKDGELVLGDTSSNKVLVINSDNEVVRKIGANPGMSGSIMKPTGIAFIQNLNVLIVADWLGDCVHLFSYGGEYLGNVMGSRRMNCPHSIHVHGKSLLISDCTNHQIVALTFDLPSIPEESRTSRL